MMDKKYIGIIMLTLIMIGSAIPAFAADSASSTQTVKVNVKPTIAIAATWKNGGNNSSIDLGSLSADGLTTTFNGGATGEQLFTYSNIAIDVYTRASGDFSDGSGHSISLSNFQYSGGSVGSATAFTNAYFKMYSNWAKAPQGSYNVAPINLYLTVPFGTDPGNYTTTVYFSAVNAGNTTAPTTP